MPNTRETPDRRSLHWLSDRVPAFVPRAMVVLAHPDDETVGAASVLPRLSLANFVYVTDGAPYRMDDAHRAGCATREAYAAIRWGELVSALASVGISADRVERADVPDQRASHQLAPLARWLEVLVRERAPEVVLTHAYEGGHPDHDATAFAVHQACRRIERVSGWAPEVVEFTSYHAGPDGGWRFAEFLEPANSMETATVVLTPSDRRLKRRLLGCYASQRGALQEVPLEHERFRRAPAYDFLQPPHPGVLLYERFPWGMTGGEWRARARAALGDLFEAPAEDAIAAGETRPMGSLVARIASL